MASYTKEEIKNFSVIYKEINKLLNVDATYQEKVRNLKYKVQLIMDKNNNVLNSYIMGRRLLINEKETNDLMNVLGVTKEQIDNIMNMSPVFDEYRADTKRKPMYLNLPLVVFSSELYRLGKKEDAFFVYFIIFLRAYASKVFSSFRIWNEEIDKRVMEYVVNIVLDDRYDLKKYGSILDVLMKTASNSFEHYIPELAKPKNQKDMFIANDVLTSGIYTRVGSTIKKVADKFFKAKADKKYLDFENSSAISTDEETEGASYSIEVSSIASYKQNLIQKALMNISTAPIDDKIINLAIKKAYPGVSNPRNSAYFDIVKTAVKSICEAKNKELYEYFDCIVSSYFYNLDRFTGKKHTTADVKSPLFIENCRYFFISPNTKDPNILKVRKMTAEFLDTASEYYQTHTGNSSRSCLRIAVYCYLVYFIYLTAKR